MDADLDLQSLRKEAVIVSMAICLAGGEFLLAAIILGVFVIALAIMAGIAKSL
jgi:hypothetical protein